MPCYPGVWTVNQKIALSGTLSSAAFPPDLRKASEYDTPFTADTRARRPNRLAGRMVCRVINRAPASVRAKERFPMGRWYDQL